MSLDRTLIPRGRGSNRAISISKTKKITASKKNRREKGNRAELLGSNPHSKGDLFSRSRILRKERENLTNNRPMTIKRANKNQNQVICILFKTNLSSLD